MAGITLNPDFLKRIAAKTTGVPYLNEAMAALEVGEYRLAAELLQRYADAQEARLHEAWNAGQGWKVA